jgi:hypothetical protein
MGSNVSVPEEPTKKHKLKSLSKKIDGLIEKINQLEVDKKKVEDEARKQTFKQNAFQNKQNIDVYGALTAPKTIIIGDYITINYDYDKAELVIGGKQFESFITNLDTDKIKVTVDEYTKEVEITKDNIAVPAR